MRDYPTFDQPQAPLKRPISFVTVHFCNELKHNLMTSGAVSDDFNELIIVDNRQNLFFDTLGQAMLHGINQAKNDLIVVVHEDVVLRDGWQQQFERSLEALEQHDPNWGMLGVIGWINDQQKPGEKFWKGHVSDPHSYRNNLDGALFHPVARLDEQLLVFHRSRMPEIDPNLPSIHYIGFDLYHQLSERNQQSYVIDAPTIHKFADNLGKPIHAPSESPKIADRQRLTYQADHALSEDYYLNKWNLPPRTATKLSPTPDQNDTLDSPIILLGRGGGGTRLVSSLTQDCELFIGNNLNRSGDCIDMVNALYRGVLTNQLSQVPWQKDAIIPEIRQASAQMLEQANWPDQWGFKLPESLLLLPELHAAFPNARYVHFRRDPISTILRRSHMTARLGNHLGRVTIRAAYDYFGIERAKALTVNDTTRMAITTAHQLALVKAHQAKIPTDRWLDLSFEDTITDPQAQLELLSNFTGLPIVHNNTRDIVDTNRSTKGNDTFDPETRARIETLYNDLIAQPIA
jgi:hypothetical protein